MMAEQKDMRSSIPARRAKLQITTEQPMAEGHWNTTKKTYPMSKDKGEIAMR